MSQAENLKTMTRVSGDRLPERVPTNYSRMMSRATGGTPQTSGAGQLGDYKHGCGYNKIFEHRVMWQEGFYDGRDEDWLEVGIPMHVIESINNEVKGMFGWHFNTVDNTKQAIITFSDPDDAFWFRLKHVKQGNT